MTLSGIEPDGAHHAPVKEIIQRKFEIVRKPIPVCLTKLRSQLAGKGEFQMTAFKATVASTVTSKTRGRFDSFVSVAIFSGIGLLLSVSVLLLDKYIPGEWF
jgi:hypothetical protein